MANSRYTRVAQAANFTGDDQTRYGQYIKGLQVTLDITSVPGVDTVLLTIERKDAASGKYSTILAGVAEVAAATRVYTVYPGLTAAANAVASDVLPDQYRVRVTHSGAGALNYTIGCVELG